MLKKKGNVLIDVDIRLDQHGCKPRVTCWKQNILWVDLKRNEKVD
jgi:hypothetical protein